MNQIVPQHRPKQKVSSGGERSVKYASSGSNVCKDNFLIDVDGDASKFEAYINEIVGRGETKKFDVFFTVPNTAKTLKFIHQFKSNDKNVVIPVTFSR